MMTMRTRAAATLVAVVALLAPAAVAHAESVRSATVSVGDAVVYPAADGYVDETQISGSLTSSAGMERVRASVVVTIGTRVAKVWFLSATGPFSFTWDGRIGGSIVSGRYTVTVRDEAAILATSVPFSVSAKKVTRVTTSRSGVFDQGLGFECWDDHDYVFTDPRYFPHLLKICPLGFGTPVSYDSAKASGRLYIWHEMFLPSAVRNSLGPVRFTVTGVFTQTGAGANKIWACHASDCASSGVRTWSGNATQTVSASIGTPSETGEEDAHWMLRMDQGHQLTVANKSYRVTFTYYALR